MKRETVELQFRSLNASQLWGLNSSLSRNLSENEKKNLPECIQVWPRLQWLLVWLKYLSLQRSSLRRSWKGPLCSLNAKRLFYRPVTLPLKALALCVLAGRLWELQYSQEAFLRSRLPTEHKEREKMTPNHSLCPRTAQKSLPAEKHLLKKFSVLKHTHTTPQSADFSVISCCKYLQSYRSWKVLEEQNCGFLNKSRWFFQHFNFMNPAEICCLQGLKHWIRLINKCSPEIFTVESYCVVNITVWGGVGWGYICLLIIFGLSLGNVLTQLK